jgi:hypothetical protein
MKWRAIGNAGEPFPAWVRALKNKSGVYAIRTRGWFSTTIVYVGESHTGGLYKTLTRHFQGWHRQKKFWFGQYAPAQTDPGHTYDRGDVEIAVRTSSRDRALSLQADWIARLKPRDNHAGVEEVPF